MSVIAFYEKVIKVKADVASRRRPSFSGTTLGTFHGLKSLGCALHHPARGFRLFGFDEARLDQFQKFLNRDACS